MGQEESIMQSTTMTTTASYAANPTPLEIEDVRRMAYYGNLKGVRAAINAIESRFPCFLQTIAGPLTLLLATLYAIDKKRLGVVRYLCVVPSMAE